MYLPLTLRFPFQYTMITNLLKKNNQWTNFYYQEFNFVILIPVTNFSSLELIFCNKAYLNDLLLYINSWNNYAKYFIFCQVTYLGYDK